MAKDINRRIAAEISWSRTYDRSARTRPAREAFLKRFEREVDPDGTLPPEERRRLAEHAKRAYMLRLAKRAVASRRAQLGTAQGIGPSVIARDRYLSAIYLHTVLAAIHCRWRPRLRFH